MSWINVVVPFVICNVFLNMISILIFYQLDNLFIQLQDLHQINYQYWCEEN